MHEELEAYVKEIEPEINKIEELLRVLMPDTPVYLITYITELRAHCIYLNSFRCKLQLMSREADFNFKPVKTKEMTEWDREVMLKSIVKDYEYWLDRLDGIIRILEGHSSMAQSILSFEKSAMSHLNSGGV